MTHDDLENCENGCKYFVTNVAVYNLYICFEFRRYTFIGLVFLKFKLN